MAWLNSSWTRRVRITIPAAQVDAALTDFPFYVRMADLPSDFHSALKSDATDIRITTSDGTTEVPRHIVTYDAGADTGTLWFKGSHANTGDVDFYIYGGNAAASDYAASDPYGSQNVYNSNIKAFYHMQGSSADSTANGVNGTDTNMTYSTTAGYEGQGASFNGSSSEIDIGSVGTNANYSFSYWVNLQGTGGAIHVGLFNGTNAAMYFSYNHLTANQLTFANYDGADSKINCGALSTSTWYHIVGTRNSSGAGNVYINNASPVTGTLKTNSTPTTLNSIGYYRPANILYHNGYIDSVSIWDKVLSAAEVDAIYTNMSDPTTFYTVGAMESFGYDNQSKSSIVVSNTFSNQSKSSIVTTNTSDNQSKANLNATATYTHNNVSKGNVTDTYTYDNKVRNNIIDRSINRKTFEYRVYDVSTQQYITTWSSEVISVPTFTMAINSGPGEMSVKLSRPFDSFGEDDDVRLFNKVECWVFDREAPSGQLLYTGYISGYKPVMSELKEYVLITLLPYSAQLSYTVLRDGAGDTTITQTDEDPAQIFRNIIDYYRADGGTVYYTDDSITDAGTVVSYSFKTYSVREALDKAIQLTPVNWYWRVDADNILYLHESNMSTEDHSFLIGKHINNLETQRRGEDLVNRIYFVGDDTGGVAIYRVYSNTASIDSYGLRSIKLTDSRVTSTSTADIIANRKLARQKDPEIRTQLVIVDSNGTPKSRGYDIESIKPGQTLRIRNIKHGVKTISQWDIALWDEDVWDQTLAYAAADVIQIQSVDYTPTAVTITASSRAPEISKRIEDINRNWEENAARNTPTTPTVV